MAVATGSPNFSSTGVIVPPGHPPHPPDSPRSSSPRDMTMSEALSDDEAAASRTKSVTSKMSSTIKNVLRTMIQHAETACKAISHLPKPKASQGKTNPGHAIESLLIYAGIRWSADGRRIWHHSAPSEPAIFAETVAPNSLRPKEKQHSAMGEADGMDGPHDFAAPTTGSSAARAAAAAARPPLPQELPLLPPATGERIGRIATARTMVRSSLVYLYGGPVFCKSMIVSSRRVGYLTFTSLP